MIKYILALLVLCSVSFGQTNTKAQFIPLSTTAFSGVTGTYANLYTNTKALTHIDFINKLNCDVTLSFDEGVTNHFILLASTSLSLDLASFEKYWGSNVAAKGSGCSSGNFYIQGIY